MAQGRTALGPGPVSGDLNGGPRNMPILPSSSSKPVSPTSHGDPMDVTLPASNSMAPPVNSSPEVDPHTSPNGTSGEFTGNHNTLHGNALTAAAATSSQQPKMVNTAFIHKLYNMLEDPTIHELIAWSADGEGFLMSPSAEFAKVLAQYFKHTNVSSFVRQLNMYGFHKVSDVFHNGQPESALWQFKHGGGNFKRGDLNGLREIKRRASKHTLIHRDSFSGPTPHKPSVSQPGTPAEPLLDPGEARMVNIEHNMYEMHARLVRTEESNTALSAKCQALNESLVKAHQWHIETTHMITALIPDPDNPVRRDASTLEKDIARHLDMIRSYEEPHEALLSGRQPYFGNMALVEPVSPRQAPLDERRTSLHAAAPRPTMFRPPVPPSHHNIPMPQRRYGSIGTANPLPNYHRPLQPQTHMPPAPHAPHHPLANVQESPNLHDANTPPTNNNNGPNLGRRHTAADIRATPGWPTQAGGPNPHNTNTTTGSPLASSGHSSGHWPSSPTAPPPSSHMEDQIVRDQLSSYTFGAPRQQSFSNQSSRSHQTTTPPLTSTDTTTPSTLSVESGWSFNGGGGAGNPSKFNPTSNNNIGPSGAGGGGGLFTTSSTTTIPRHTHVSSLVDPSLSAPQTRRSSMASNVHSLLNPAETVERDEEDPLGGGGIGREEERKRKRVL